MVGKMCKIAHSLACTWCMVLYIETVTANRDAMCMWLCYRRNWALKPYFDSHDGCKECDQRAKKWGSRINFSFHRRYAYENIFTCERLAASTHLSLFFRFRRILSYELDNSKKLSRQVSFSRSDSKRIGWDKRPSDFVPKNVCQIFPERVASN